MKKFLKALHRQFKQRVPGEDVINSHGNGIVNFIDIGSSGDLPTPWNKNVGTIQHLLKFEPRDNSSNTPNIKIIDTALWESNCEKEFYIYKGFGGSGSSLFQQNYQYVTENYENLRNKGPKRLADTWFERSKLDRIEKINCRRLDDVLQELPNSFNYHFMKIDAQGAEYEILKGAERFLSESCLGLHLELFVLPLYKEIKLLSEVSEYLNDFGFELIKKYPAHGTFDSQHDCVFLKRGHSGKIVDTILKVYKI